MKFMKKIAAVVAATAVATVSMVAASISVSADGKSEPPYTAWIATSMGKNQMWNAGDWEDKNANITGDGVYTVSATVPEDGGSETVEFLSLETDINVYAFVAEGGDYKTEGTLKLEIKKIWVGHFDGSETEIAYNGPGDKAYCTRDDGSSARMNILNERGGGVKMTNDIDKNIPGGIAAGETINIQFAVSGINAGGGTATTDPASTTEAPKNTDPNGTTADPSKTTAAGETTTTAAGGSNGGNNSSNGGSSNGGSSNGSSSGSSNGSTNNATTSQTGDFGIAAIVLGAVATAALGAGAYTITRKKK